MQVKHTVLCTSQPLAMCFWPLMSLDTMLLVSKSIVLSLGLCEPLDHLGAKFCYFRSLVEVSKCLDISTLLGTTFLNYKSEIQKM